MAFEIVHPDQEIAKCLGRYQEVRWLMYKVHETQPWGMINWTESAQQEYADLQQEAHKLEDQYGF